MLELLSPAGSPEAVTAAVQNGADAVYLGCGDFNARRRARNFTIEGMRNAAAYCHVRGVKVYLTLNTLLSDRELPGALAVAEAANDAGVDGVLVQDLGLAARLKARFPDLPLHGSTQMTVHSLDGVRLCARLGLTRVVLSRELSGEAIAHICAQSPIEIEVFVHGALCMCYSGQCFLSAMLGGRSGNRGLCAQPCRLPYDGGHPLSLKDMSLAGYLQALDKMGVRCVKIEGRMKRAEYVAIVTRVYAAALREGREPTAEELERLRSAFSRSGFTQGYFLGQTGPAMFGVRSQEAETDELYAAARETCRGEAPLVPVDLAAAFRPGAPMTLTVTDRQGRSAQSVGPVPEAARSRETTADEAARQLAKTGGTPYRADRVAVDLAPGLALPKSALNALRRSALDALTARRAEPPRRRTLAEAPLVPVPGPQEAPALFFTLRTLAQLTQELRALPHRRVDLPLGELAAHPDQVKALLAQGERLRVQLPRVCWDRERPALEEQLEAVAALGVTDALIPTWDMVDPARKYGFALYGDFGLGAYNSHTLRAMADLGFAGATVSFELKAPMIRDLDKSLALEAIVYGHLPLMMLEQFPGGRPTDGVTDRLGVTFPILPAPGGRAELFNAQPLWLADKDEFRHWGLTGARLLFTTESPRRCAHVAGAYLSGGPPPKAFTRGLYYRSVE